MGDNKAGEKAAHAKAAGDGGNSKRASDTAAGNSQRAKKAKGLSFSIERILGGGAKTTQEQKMLSMDYNEEWWFRKLQNGRIFEDEAEWDRFAPSERVVKDFVAYMELWRQNRRGNETSLGRFLNRMVPHLKKTQKRITVEVSDEMGQPRREARRANFYDFGTLDQCRKAWEKNHGRVEWEDPVQLDLDQPENDPF